MHDLTPTDALAYGWKQKNLQEGSLLEESLGILRRDEVLRLALGVGYETMMIVRGRGSFVLERDDEVVVEAELDLATTRFEFIPLVNRLEERLRHTLSQESVRPEELLALLADHQAYYDLAKKEASQFYAAPKATVSDQRLIERWRSDEARWDLYDEIWERVSERCSIAIEDLHFCLIDEVRARLAGQPLDLDQIRAREAGPWTLTRSGTELALVLEDGAPFSPESEKTT